MHLQPEQTDFEDVEDKEVFRTVPRRAVDPKFDEGSRLKKSKRKGRV
jgi:hypothetical protein